MYYKLTIPTILILTIIGFQNCSEVEFGTTQEKSMLVGGDVEDNDKQGSFIVDPVDSEPIDSESDPENTIDSSNSNLNSGGPLIYQCVLEGPGKSIRLKRQLIGDLFHGAQAMPQAVCTTRAACLELVSVHFNVKEAFVGPCRGGNPHLIRMTEDEIADALFDQFGSL